VTSPTGSAKFVRRNGPESGTPPAAERTRLEAALDPPTVTEALTVRLGGSGSCRVLNAKYDPGKRAWILYELDGRHVVGALEFASGEGFGSGVQAVGPLDLELHPFPQDPALPTLPTVLNGGEIARVAVARVLKGRRVLQWRAEVLRYRPMRRCTLRVELSLSGVGGSPPESRVLYAKVYHDASKATATYEDMQMLATSPELRASGVTVARPVAWLPELATVLAEPVAGTTLEEHLAGECHHLAVERAAQALAGLHSSGHRTRRVRPIGHHLERMAKRAHRAERVDESMGRAFAKIAAAATEWLGDIEDVPATITHGDFKPSQVLIDRENAALLDFDHCGMADAASDVGNFAASLQQRAVRDGDADLDDLLESFLRSYMQRVEAPKEFQSRVRFYTGVSLLRKAWRSWQRDPRSPGPRVLLSAARGYLDQTAYPRPPHSKPLPKW